MRNPNRIEPMLEAIKVVWKKHPDLRLGQLIENLACLEGSTSAFYIEDDRLEAIAKTARW